MTACWVPVLMVWAGAATSTSNVSRRRCTPVSRHETLTVSPTAAGPVWLTHTWVPTVVSPSSGSCRLHGHEARLLDEALDHRDGSDSTALAGQPAPHVGAHVIARSMLDAGSQVDPHEGDSCSTVTVTPLGHTRERGFV